MRFYIFVLFFVLFFNLNRCEPIKVSRIRKDNDKFNQQTLSVSNKSNNYSEIERVETLETPYKLENDKKLYRVIRLSNNLTALLVSTQENQFKNGEKSNETMEYSEFRQKKSACTLAIDVGSMSDPRNIQGMAHLIEHMVFKGSKKYPGEIEFYEFTRKSGGDTHAGTNYDSTTYGFEAYEEFLNETLDRFVQFFKAPIMLKESLLREREAVESEFSTGKNDDDERQAHLIGSLGETTHPSNIFRCGNLKSLKENIDDNELYRKAVEFRSRQYSAQRMYLCLQSNQSLDNLQEMVIRHFSTVPNNNMPGDDFSAFTHLNAFQPKFHEKVFFVKPIRSGSNIVITWCLEPMKKNFKQKTLYILSYLLGHEGKGSLLSYLRKKLWATELNAWNGNNGHKFNVGNNEIFTFFDIYIRLTENGFDHLDDVLAAVFSYLKFYQHVKLNETHLHDLRAAFVNVYRFSREPDTYDNVKFLSKNMLQYPSEYIVRASDYLFDYDADAVKKTIDHLNLRKFNIMITPKRSRSKRVVYKSTEPWYGIKYREVDMPAKWIELHQKAKPLPEFTLPESNPFIADNFTILNTGGSVDSRPYVILYNDSYELWYRPDNEISRPYAEYYLYFLKPHAESSIENKIQMTLMATWLNYQIVEKLYPSAMVGLQYACYQSQTGVLFKVTGFNQKMHLIFDIFGKTLKSLATGPTEDEFNMFVNQQLENYEKEILNPETIAAELQTSVVQSAYRSIWEKYKQLRSISFSNFQKFCRNFCAEVKIEALAHGNMDEDYATNIMQNILNNFECERIDRSTLVYMFEESLPKKLPIGAHYLRVKNFNALDAGSTITNFYQIGPNECNADILLDLLDVIAAEQVYDTLRNKEQLAYYVSFSSHNDLGLLGYSIIVCSQETKFTADHVDERIENLRRKLLTIIEQMSLDDFETFKRSMVKSKWIEYDKRIDGNQFNWWSDRERFMGVEESVENLLAITKAQLLEFYRTHLDAAKQRKLSIQVIGNTQANESDSDSDDIVGSFDKLTYVNFTGEPKGNLIEDLIEFRNSLEQHDFSEEEKCSEEFSLSSGNPGVIKQYKAVYYYSFISYIFYLKFVIF